VVVTKTTITPMIETRKGDMAEVEGNQAIEVEAVMDNHTEVVVEVEEEAINNNTNKLNKRL